MENIFSLFVVRGAELLITVLLIPYIIDKIGVENYGSYVYAFAYVMFFTNLMGYGFDISTVRDISETNCLRDIETIFNRTLSAKLYLFLFLLPLYFLGVFFLNNKFLFVLTSLLLVSELLSFRWLFYGMLKIRVLAFFSVLSTCVFLILIFNFVDSKEDFVYINLYHAIGGIVTGVLALIFIIQKYKFSFSLIPFAEVLVFLKKDAVSFVNLMIPSILANTVVFVVGSIVAPISVSVVQLGVKYTNVFSTVNTIFTQVLYPFVNRAKKMFELSAYILLCIGGFVSILMFVSSTYLIPIWLNDNSSSLIIENTILSVKYLSICPLLMSVISAYGVNGLLILKKDRLYAAISIFIIVLCIFLSFILVCYFDFLGGVYVLIIARASYGIISFYFYKKCKK